MDNSTFELQTLRKTLLRYVKETDLNTFKRRFYSWCVRHQSPQTPVAEVIASLTEWAQTLNRENELHSKSAKEMKQSIIERVRACNLRVFNEEIAAILREKAVIKEQNEATKEKIAARYAKIAALKEKIDTTDFDIMAAADAKIAAADAAIAAAEVKIAAAGVKLARAGAAIAASSIQITPADIVALAAQSAVALTSSSVGAEPENENRGNQPPTKPRIS